MTYSQRYPLNFFHVKTQFCVWKNRISPSSLIRQGFRFESDNLRGRENFEILLKIEFLNLIILLFSLSPNLINLSRVSNPPKFKSIERLLKSWKIEYNFMWNQSHLSHGSNSFNSDSGVQSSQNLGRIGSDKAKYIDR